MFNKKFFFQNSKINTKKFKKNIKLTKKAFSLLNNDIYNSELPLLKSFDKSYEFDFSTDTIKKFSKYKNIILIGMGGSILGTKSIYSFLKKKIKKNIFFFDNLDVNLQSDYKNIKKIKNSCFVVISKSGATLEVLTNFFTVFSKNLFRNKLIIITETKNSPLAELGIKHKAEIIEHKDFIGGRYSVLSEVGMLPAALMGLKIKDFKNFDKLINNKYFKSSLIHNVAYIHTLFSRGVKNSVLLSYDKKLNDLCHWYQQLTAESLGKKGKGITPIVSYCPKDHHSVLQLFLDGPKDKFFTFFNCEENSTQHKIPKHNLSIETRFLKKTSLESIVKAQADATQKIFKLKNLPFRKIIFKKINEEELGSCFIFLILETILLARLMKVDPFNQPAVESVKIETKKIILSR